MPKPINGRQYLAKQIWEYLTEYDKCQQQLKQATTKEERAKIRKELQRLAQRRLILDATAAYRSKS